jgi:hypothetical protein
MLSMGGGEEKGPEDSRTPKGTRGDHPCYSVLCDHPCYSVL